MENSVTVMMRVPPPANGRGTVGTASLAILGMPVSPRPQTPPSMHAGPVLHAGHQCKPVTVGVGLKYVKVMMLVAVMEATCDSGCKSAHVHASDALIRASRFILLSIDRLK